MAKISDNKNFSLDLIERKLLPFCHFKAIWMCFSNLSTVVRLNVMLSMTCDLKPISKTSCTYDPFCFADTEKYCTNVGFLVYDMRTWYIQGKQFLIKAHCVQKRYNAIVVLLYGSSPRHLLFQFFLKKKFVGGKISLVVVNLEM